MNLFVEDLAAYLIKEWKTIQDNPTGTHEARFVLESMAPDAIFELLALLEKYRYQVEQQISLECHFKVANGLWQKWQEQTGQSRAELIKQMRALGGVDADGSLRWIDEADHLTWYRNRTRPDNKAMLVVVLIGIGHTADKGGLTDFHQVTEERIWQTCMEESYQFWLERLGDTLDLNASENQLKRFEEALIELFIAKPRRLLPLAKFFAQQLIPACKYQGAGDFDQVLQVFYQLLPFWHIPPLVIADDKIRKTKDLTGLIREADILITHQRLKTSSEQKKAWEKVVKMLNDADFELPTTFDPNVAYKDERDYEKTLWDFIHTGDSKAAQRLMQTDVYALVKALKKPIKKTVVSKDKIGRLQGSSMEAFLQAIWQTILRFAKECKDEGEDWWDYVASLDIKAEYFAHDLDADDNDISGHALARELLHGCLGGLAEVLQALDLRLPVDQEQADLPFDSWTKEVTQRYDLIPSSDHDYKTSRKRPHLRFKVTLKSGEHEEASQYTCTYEWVLDATHAERVRYQCAKAALEAWQPHKVNAASILPAFTLDTETLTALYYAADEEEANRLLNNALGNMEVKDVLAGLGQGPLDAKLTDAVNTLAYIYWQWLAEYVKQGYYQATQSKYGALQNAYGQLANVVLDAECHGSRDVLSRFYKAFLLMDTEQAKPSSLGEHYLRSAVVLGITPAMLEMTEAREIFLRNHFPEVLVEYIHEQNFKGPQAKKIWERLLDLVTLQRPLAGLLVNGDGKLSAQIKNFNLVHYLGEPPGGEKSLAVQTLLREDDDNDDDISEIRHVSEDSKIIHLVIQDYQKLYAFAADGLRILAVYVDDVPLILSGVDYFLKQYLPKKRSSDDPAFFCEVMVYSTSSSPLAIEKKLLLWRDALTEQFREKGRRLNLAISHRFAPNQTAITELLRKEQRLYDIAFLFRFLGDQLSGKVEHTQAFTVEFGDPSKFPISEYPRPIYEKDPCKRENLLSNRRLRIQSWHTNLSGRLRTPDNNQTDYLMIGRVDYEQWRGVIDQLHQQAQWVACVDSFIDKRLLTASEQGNNQRRKIVGFTSGLGAYGELNLAISTQHDTLNQLITSVKSQLKDLTTLANIPIPNAVAECIVEEAEAVIGLSCLRAVMGQGERIREVIGFAAIQRLLAKPATAVMTQLLPLDAFSHWLTGVKPDLLQLSLTLRDNDIPLIQAQVIECKLAYENARYLDKAKEQVQSGLEQLTQLFAPANQGSPDRQFDRRYWWAQLQRALTSRATVPVAMFSQQKQLHQALETIVQGEYEIEWRCSIFTFWLNKSIEQNQAILLDLPADTLRKPFALPPGFKLNYWQLSSEQLVETFKQKIPAPLGNEGEPLRIKALKANERFMPKLVTVPSGIEDLDDTPVAPAIVPPVVPPQVWIEDTKPDVKPSVAVVPPPIQHPYVAVIETPLFTQVPEKILLGRKASNQEPVYWHYGHTELNNRHMLLFGSSGSGKTYAIQCLLAEMTAQRLHALIIDYTDGFMPDHVEECFQQLANPQQHYVRIDKLPLSPFRRQMHVIDPAMPALEESAYDVASRVSSIFTSVFANLGPQQAATLARVLEAGLNKQPDFGLEDLLEALRQDSQTGETLANRLEPFVKAQPFRQGEESSWQHLLTAKDNKVNILQLKGLSRDIYRLVTEFILWDLYDYACTHGSRNHPIPIVLDEIQNLDHRSDSPIDKMLREGRKFGLSLILATQTISNFDQEQRDRLFQAGHKLFFKPADTEIKSFAKILTVIAPKSSENEWASKLAQLRKGQCYSVGYVLNSENKLTSRVELVNITSLEERQLGGANGYT